MRTDLIIDLNRPLDRGDETERSWLGRQDGVWYPNINADIAPYQLPLGCTRCGTTWRESQLWSLHGPHGKCPGGYWWTYCRNCLNTTIVGTPQWRAARGLTN